MCLLTSRKAINKIHTAVRGIPPGKFKNSISLFFNRIEISDGRLLNLVRIDIAWFIESALKNIQLNVISVNTKKMSKLLLKAENLVKPIPARNFSLIDLVTAALIR